MNTLDNLLLNLSKPTIKEIHDIVPNEVTESVFKRVCIRYKNGNCDTYELDRQEYAIYQAKKLALKRVS